MTISESRTVTSTAASHGGLRDILTIGLYSFGLGAGILAGFVALLLAA